MSLSIPPIPGAGRRLTLVEDSPIQRKVLGDFLRRLGFEVVAVGSAGEALEHLLESRPHAVVCDVVMPEIDGFALCRTIKDDPALEAIPVLLLTSTDIDESDEQLAGRAGAEALVPRTPGFGPLVEALLVSLDAPKKPLEEGARVLIELRARFLSEGRVEAARLAGALEGGDDGTLRRTVHRWAGRGSTLGFPGITAQSRVLEGALDRGDHEAARDALAVIDRLFREGSSDGGGVESRPERARQAPAVPTVIAGGLADRRVALVGFPLAEAERMAGALALARARAETVVWRDGLGSPLHGYDLSILSAYGERGGAPWLSPGALADCESALLLVGDPQTLLITAPELECHSILVAPWAPEALLLRSFLALHDGSGDSRRHRRLALRSREIVVADDDPTILVLLEATLRSYGCRCHLAEDGVEAIEMTRRVRPSALILDINMPGRDGYEVLSTLRGDRRTRGVPIVLLTARHQEADVIRAFDLGASEYIVKPFNPMELVARLRRLVEP